MGDNEKQTTSEPDLDIPAQDLQYSTEGLEISNDATNVEILNESD